MTALLTDQRCWIHEEREAAARCLSCHRFFCRECITEHAGQMMCAECVARSFAPRRAGERSRALAWTVLSFTGVLVAWLVFYYLGQALAQIPSDFHI
jgi:hypothetical protein